MSPRKYLLMTILLLGAAMSEAGPDKSLDSWMPLPTSLTAPQQAQLRTVYQLMLAGKPDEAEQALAALHAQNPAVQPLWLALLTEQQQFARLRQLVAAGVLPASHNSAVIARAYAKVGQPAVRFEAAQGELAMQGHFMIALPRVRLQLNGRSYYFVLDTGASQSLVTDQVVSELGLRTVPDAGVEIDTATDNVVKAGLVHLPTFRLGPAVAENQLAVVVARDSLEQRVLGLNWYQLDGILGWPLIKQLDLTIDFAANKLQIRQPQKKAGRGNLVWLFDDPMVISDQAGKPRLWFLDTGAGRSLITGEYLDASEKQALQWDEKQFGGLGGKGTVEKVGKFGPVQIRFPSYTRHFEQLTVRTGHQDCTHSRCDGRLGVDIAKNRRMHINFQAGEFDVSEAR